MPGEDVDPDEYQVPDGDPEAVVDEEDTDVEAVVDEVAPDPGTAGIEDDEGYPHAQDEEEDRA